jgi:methylenetetrahydrofolate dehydrogenase (NADP+)/methenyltetrahydrofolate cyclohydrolase
MEHATVTQCHTRTKDIPGHARQADILVIGAGNPDLVTPDWVTEKSVVIDVSSPKGDCSTHYKEIEEKVHAITPVPGGVGPMTIASLLENTYEAAQMRRGKL